jgi:uncharacterized protein
MATALITGGTSGIGANFARILASRGYDLVLVARDAERLEAVAKELTEATGVAVTTIRADLSKRADVGRVADRLEDSTQPIEMLVNNAGFGVHTKLASVDTEPHEHALLVMVNAVLVLGGAAARAMRARGHGTIINVSSTAGFITMGSYSAIKAWVTSYSEGLAVELRGSGVHVTALCPGWVRTEFHERAGINAASIPRALWVDGDHLVESALRDAKRGRVISIPSLRFKLLVFALRHVPRRTVRSVSGSLSSKRSEAQPIAGEPALMTGSDQR